MKVAQQKDLLTGRWRKVVAPQRESAFHIQLVSMLRWCLRPDVIMRHVPNGEHRDPRTAAKLKAMGVLAGAADLEFHWCEMPLRRVPFQIEPSRFPPEPDRNAPKVRRMLHLELKLPGRKQSEAQAGYALAMKLFGDEYHVVRSIDEAIGILGERGLLRSDVEVCGRRW